MGYQVNFKYHPKKEESKLGFEFDVDIIKEKNHKIGKKEEEVKENDLANFIIQQLSRRDIYIFEVSVIEYVKKELKVKTCQGGIIIGKKKYLLGDSSNSEVDVEDEENNELSEDEMKKFNKFMKNYFKNNPNKINNASITPAPTIIPPLSHTVIKEEYFYPNEILHSQSSKFRNIGLTIGKKYKIIREINAGGIQKYTVLNDAGGKVDIPVEHFVVNNPSSISIELQNTSSELELSYPGETQVDTLKIR